MTAFPARGRPAHDIERRAHQGAHVAGIYLLVGTVAGYLLEWFERDKIVWREFAIVPAVGIVAVIVLSVAGVFLYRVINGDINQIRKSSPENRHE